MLAPALVLTACLGASLSPDYGAYVQASMETWKVPGVAVAVVQGGKPALLQGYGVREVGKPEKVDGHTAFPLASLTKGFTAAAAAQLVEQGQLGWDDLVTQHLPTFAVADPEVTRALTVRDLAAHRTGLSPLADSLWYGTRYGRADVLQRLRFLPQSEPFRSGYSYHNVTYLVLGQLLAARAGKPWEALVRAQLLEPLKMTDASTSLRALAAHRNAVAPHSDEGEVARKVAPLDPDNIAPAAALHASAADLVRWMRVLLEGGTLDGKRVFAAETVEQLFTPQTLIPLGPATRKLYPESHFEAYGLGWVLQDYRGRQVAWNTGGLDGVSCTIALVREENLGVAVLTNGGRTSFPEAMVFRALDELLGAPTRKDWSAVRRELSLAHRARQAKARADQEAARVPGTHPTHPLSRYVGAYTQPLLGTLAVSEGKGGLAVDLAGLTGRAEHWNYDTFLVRWERAPLGTSLVTFALDARGAPTRAAVEDAGDFFRVP